MPRCRVVGRAPPEQLVMNQPQPREPLSPGPETCSTPEAWHEAGKKALAERKAGEALAAFQKALALNPDDVPALVGMARLHFHPQRPEAALRLIARAQEVEPGHAETHRTLALFLHQLGDRPQAEARVREAIRLDNAESEQFRLLAEIVFLQGRVREGVEALAESVKRDPSNAAAHGSLLFAQNYLEPADPREEVRRICEFDRHTAPLAPENPPYPNEPAPDRKLRVGYVSPDFRWHAVAHFARPVLAAHDREQVEVWCYAEYAAADLNTLRFKEIADHWRPTKGVSDEDLARRIHEDRIDILVDLAGHSAHNRLLVFGRRPAPVQVSWLGYCNSTGVRAIGYRITDAFCDPPGPADELSREKLVRLPCGFHCYQPPEEDPPVRPAPCLRNGCVTFGSFNNFRKHTPAVVSLWARVLHAVPGSRLLMKTGDYVHVGIRRFFLEAFASHGIGPDRVRLATATLATSRHQDLFGQVDICLDPFPYNGTTTTCDALWMGVPVVTLEGRLHRARVGGDLLTRVGHPEWIGATPEDYVRIARDLASDAPALNAIRPRLREDMRRSALCDGRRIAEALEDAYRGMWHEWINKQILKKGD
ncbi:MAG: tetratricopeptide repeat protein [Verrucomicrobia bacterium]|nr:tetratricopeptide repeat protein [Verrucomicrobiota bacterium]